jgi:hypothetical protein
MMLRIPDRPGRRFRKDPGTDSGMMRAHIPEAVRLKKSVRDGESRRFCRDVLLPPVAKAVVLSRSAIALPAAYRPAPADTLPQ